MDDEDTCNLFDGFVVPMPTLPPPKITMAFTSPPLNVLNKNPPTSPGLSGDIDNNASFVDALK